MNHRLTWLEITDARWREVRQVVQSDCGQVAAVWQQRWRMLFVVCEELFSFDEGNAWLVLHYRSRLG